MTPAGSLSSDGYALADTTQAQKDVLAWTEDGMLSLDLSSGGGETWNVYWLDTDDGTRDLVNPSVTGASNITLTSPFGGRSVVLVTQGSSELSFAPID
jgi:hypothetical protein